MMRSPKRRLVRRPRGFRVLRLANAGRLGWIQFGRTFVRAAFWGPAARRRAKRAHDLLKVPDAYWKDRTGRLRASVRIERPGTVVFYGGGAAYYGVYVEALRGGMRRAFRQAVAEVP